MRIGNRLYPYPVLNANRINSSYKETSSIQILYEQDKDDQYLHLIDVYCVIKSKYLNALLTKDLAQINLIFECPQAFYRENFIISTKPQNIDIPLADINGIYIISAVVTLKKDVVVPPNIKEFVDEYSGLTMRLEKHDIMAVDEGHKDSIHFDMEDEINQGSIFSVIPADTYQDGQMTIGFDKDQINIYISKKAYDAYCGLEKAPIYHKVFYSIFATPALLKCVNEVISENDPDKSIDNAIVNYRWFDAFTRAYEKKYGEEFKYVDIHQLEEKIQFLFDYPCGTSILLLKELNPNGQDERSGKDED